MSLVLPSEKGSALTCEEYQNNILFSLDLANATGELNCSKINSVSLNTCLSETNVINTINANTTNNANAIGEIAQDLTDVQSFLQNNINVITQLVNSQNATIAEQAQQIASLINSFNNLDNTVNSFNSRLLSIEGRVMTLEIGIAMGIIVIWSGLVTSIPISWQLCLLGDSQVLLSDGSIMEIQDIVNNKLAVEVVSYNESTGKLEAKKVINWFKNNVEDRSIWYKLKVAKAKGLGPKSLTLTKDHPVWVVNKGWTKTEYVNTGDKILRYDSTSKDLVTFTVEKKAVSELHSSKKNRRIYDIKYDIEVEDNHSFIANGFLVHNCDGTNGTPDLRNRFVVSAGSAYAVNSTGGSLNHIHTAEGSTGFTALSTSQMPAHSHGVSDPGHAHGVSDPGHGHNPILSGGGGALRMVTGGFQTLNTDGAEVTAVPGGSNSRVTAAPAATGIGIIGSPTYINIASAGGGAGHNHSVSTTIANASNLPPYYALAYIMKI